MGGFSRWRDPAAGSFRQAVLAVGIGLVLALPASGQVSPEEHEKHHPGQAQGNEGGKEGMGGMMGKTPPRQQYPALMNLPELTPERREQFLAQAHAQMQEGTALLSKGLDLLAQAAETGNTVTMRAAVAQLREGVSRLDSGVAARLALAEDKAPRDSALQWFKREMNLHSRPAGLEDPGGPFGLSWFHFFVMVVLVGFTAAMLWMYYHKMRRAAQLLQSLTGNTSTVPAAPAAEAAPATRTPTTPAATPVPGKWTGKLRVGRVFQETPDVKTFRLLNPLGGVLPFDFLPGQFLTVTVAPDGKTVKRSYTIASSPTQHDYVEITVKHEDGGVVSGFLHDRVHEGDLLDVAGPFGSFTFTGRECKCILLVGAGVGITPLMSVLRYLTDRSWSGDIYLLYGCHSPGDIIFREELDYLQRRHPNLHVVLTVSDPAGTDWKGPTGHISKELIGQSVPDVAARYVHLCGPVSLMEAVKKMLAELGVPRERIKTEAFGLALGKPEPVRSQATRPAGSGTEEQVVEQALPTVTFSRSDKSAPLRPDKVILDVADEVGVEIDNSCRVGTCGTCRVKLLSGQVTMAIEDGLESGDKEAGIILACQARSTGNVTVEA